MINITPIIFYLAALIALGSAVMVVVARNTIYNLLFLIITFIATAVLWLLLHADFLALAMLFINVGALAVLFMLTIMLLDLHKVKRVKTNWLYIAIAGGCTSILAILFIIMASTQKLGHAKHISNEIRSIGNVLYTHYFVTFELVGLLLLVAMLSAVILIKEEQ